MERQNKHRLEPILLNLGLRLLTSTLGRLPWRLGQRVGRAIGSLGWALSRRDRRRTLDHLALAYPDLPEPDRRRLGKECFRHHGASLSECLHLFHRDCEFVRSVAEVRGWEEIEAARRARRPVLILTAHCGNWELLGAALNCRGLGMAALARLLDEPFQQRMLAGLRERFGTPTIARGGEGAARQLLMTLRRGGALGILIDQDTKVDGVWVPFFGRPAFTPVAAAKMALRQKDPAVIPAFGERLPDGRHLVTIHPSLQLPDDATAATALMTAKIEEQVRRRPEQWVWMHRRWRRQPRAEVGPGGSQLPPPG